MLFLPISLLLISFRVNGDCSYTNCATNMYPINQISYPFRAYDQPKTCGLPGFDLGCNYTDRTPLLTFPSGQSFTVEYIYASAYTKEIQISDPQGCLSEKLLHLNTSNTPFRFQNVTNFTLYDCSLGILLPRGDAYHSCNRIYCSNFEPTSSVLCSNNNSNSSLLIDDCKLIGDVRFPTGNLTYPYDPFTRAYSLFMDYEMPSACQLCIGACQRNPTDLSKTKCNVLTRDVIAIITTAAILLLALVGISYVIYKCRERNRSTTSVTDNQQRDDVALEGAVAQETLDVYPVMVVGESGRILMSLEDKICVICLSEYLSKDILKTLPECLHRFHADCLDEWLRAKATCPICRTPPPVLASS